MNTISFINSKYNAEMRNKMASIGYAYDNGYANGYVAVPPNHPWFGKKYDDLDVRVHGGVTYSAPVDNVITDGAEYLWGASGVPSGWWVFGFDTNHCHDTMDIWTHDRVIEETLKFQRQIELCQKIL